MLLLAVWEVELGCERGGGKKGEGKETSKLQRLQYCVHTNEHLHTHTHSHKLTLHKLMSGP